MGDRPRPKRPDVMLASALKGTGVADLLAALDRRGAARDRDASGSRRGRAEAVVFAIVGTRVRDMLRAPGRREQTDGVLAEVAEHSLDPYAAADRLLDSIRGG
jgi:putative protein kinase ArgK-like GTPase of G3E family